MEVDDARCREIWVETDNRKSLCAMINGDIGWLMYLRHDGDAGFTSRNPDFDGSASEMIEYRLSNGQVDQCPRAWAYPTAVVEKAVEHFRNTRLPPTFIQWHNDSGDGQPIIPHSPRHGERSARAK